MGEIQALVATRKLIVNCGPGTLITCRHIPERHAYEALEGFAKWTALRDRSSSVTHVLDVTSVSGERTVLPFERVVMIRSIEDHG